MLQRFYLSQELIEVMIQRKKNGVGEWSYGVKSSSTESLEVICGPSPLEFSYTMVTAKIAGHAEYVRKFFKNITHKNFVSVYDVENHMSVLVSP